jgi:hypothetical protein
MPLAQCTGNISSKRYERIDTKVLFEGIVLGLERGEVLSFGFMDRLCPIPDTRFAGKRSFRLQQAQLAGTRDSFGATLNL